MSSTQKIYLDLEFTLGALNHATQSLIKKILIASSFSFYSLVLSETANSVYKLQYPCVVCCPALETTISGELETSGQKAHG